MCDDNNVTPFGRSNKHRRSRNVCDDNNVIPFTAANIRGVEMCVMTTSFPLGSATNIGGEEMCVMTTTSLLFGRSNKTTEKKKCV